jgi:adenylate cyclase
MTLKPMIASSMIYSPLDPTTSNAKAYEHYLRGRGYAMTQVSQDFSRSIEIFQKAVAIDPEFVRAWIALAETSARQALYHRGGDPARQIADNASDHAMKLAPERSGSYMARGFSYLATSALDVLGETERAKEWAVRALSLSPNDDSTRYNVACFYSLIGEIDKSLDLLENSITSRSWIENDSELDNIRDHPRYKAIIQAMPE